MGKVFLFMCLIFFGCQQQAHKDPVAKNAALAKQKQKKYPEIDTSKVLLTHGYYQFVRLTDSTSTVKWGNSEVSNFFNNSLDNFYFSKERTNLKWANSRFIVLGRGSGSDTWLHIVLPLVQDQPAKIYENPLATDRENGIIVCEYSAMDTVLVAENIISGRKQFFGKEWKKCSSAIHHYCIDSISISNKLLYVEWVTPNRIDKPNKKEIKRIKLKL